MTKNQYVFKTKPDSYQVQALKRAISHRKFGIFFEQRVGKTKVAIDFCGALYKKEARLKTLIVCPLSVRSEWVSQLEQHYPYEYTYYLYPKDVKKRRRLLQMTRIRHTPTFMIINYDLISNDVEQLVAWGADTIIFDESHMIGRHNSKRSKSAAKLSKDADNVLLLTGTPIPKKWYHIFGQFRAMDDRIFGSSFSKFINEWGVKGGYMGKEIVRCVDYDELSKVIADHSIRVLRRDVFEEPEVEDVIIPIELSPKSKRIYEDLKKKFIVELSEERKVTADMALTRLIKLHRICGGFLTTDDGVLEQVSRDKLDVIKDLVRTRLEGDEKVVIFHRYTAEGDLLYEELQKVTPHPIGRINGSVSEDDRLTYRTMFQDGDMEIIIIQIATGIMGIPLHRAHVNIFYSMDFSLSNYKQARDRVMGRFQKSDVTNYFLSVRGTVDEKIIKTLRNDESIASKISDTWKWVIGD